jgi:hypothetical protein
VALKLKINPPFAKEAIKKKGGKRWQWLFKIMCIMGQPFTTRFLIIADNGSDG